MNCQIEKRSTVIVKQIVIPIPGFLFIIYVQHWYVVDCCHSELLNVENRERQWNQAIIRMCIILIYYSPHMHSILWNGIMNKNEIESSKIENKRLTSSN